MVRFGLYVVLACAVLMWGVEAHAAEEVDNAVMIDLAKDHIDITTGFNGSYLTVYGVKDKPGDIAIAIKGPKRDMMVRQKQKVFGVWTNTRYTRFKDIPVYYDYAVAKRDEPLADDAVMRTLGVGQDALEFATDSKVSEERLATFKESLIRNKQAEGRFPVEPEEITFLTDNFFKVIFYIPANVPTGDYSVETFLFQDGGLQDVKTSRLRVAQVGLSSWINNASKKYSVLYALFCIVFAMSVGWMSNAIRRA